MRACLKAIREATRAVSPSVPPSRSLTTPRLQARLTLGCALLSIPVAVAALVVLPPSDRTIPLLAIHVPSIVLSFGAYGLVRLGRTAAGAMVLALGFQLIGLAGGSSLVSTAAP